jgi:glycyl-radical enzyme activating protein
MVGIVSEIQKFSIHDGPGIRTTVFLKGCPLRCRWCHNPESHEKGVEISYLPERCILCGYCARVCPEHCHRIEDGKHLFDRTRCARCGLCTKECYAKGLETIGREMTVEKVLAEALKDRAFYENSGGGITLSGGEPMLQFEFTKALLLAARREGLHTVIETCGFAPTERYREIQPAVDLFYFDIKETDSAKHREFTGVPNEQIVENLRMLDAAGARIVLRCPVIPGLNDREDHFAAVAALAETLENLLEIHVMPYHRLGAAKSQRIGKKYAMPDVAMPEEAAVKQWLVALRSRVRVPVRRD